MASRFRRYKGELYDFDPPNKSFLQTAYELRDAGVKNYFFMLKINDINAAKIDPFKPNITPPEMEILTRELQSNVWFYARTVAQIRTDKGIVQFELHRGLAASIWCFEHYIDSCLCQPRQTYKTTGLLAAPVAWAFQIASKNLTIHFFGKDMENSKSNLKKLKDSIELLPEWLQRKRTMQSDGKIGRSKRSAEKLENIVNHNEIKAEPKASGITHAEALGRGSSTAILVVDEIEFTAHFPVIFDNNTPAFMTASKNARDAGLPSGRIFMSTPGNLDTPVGRDVAPLIKSMIPWTEEIYDFDQQQLTNYMNSWKASYSELNKNATRGPINVFYLEYPYYKIRKSHEWVQAQLDAGGNKSVIRREILLQRMRGSDGSFIKSADLEAMIDNVRYNKMSAVDLLLLDKFIFKVYNHGQIEKVRLYTNIDSNTPYLDPTIPYIVGVDLADGGGGDNSAIVIVNPYNLQVAAEFKHPYITAPHVHELLVTLVTDYIPKACITIERNAMGGAVIAYLLNSSIRDNLYWWKDDKHIETMTTETPADFKLRQLALENKKHGTRVTHGVRTYMFGTLLYRHVSDHREILNTEYLVDDLCNLVRNPITGRVAAARGEHDDVCFIGSTLIATDKGNIQMSKLKVGDLVLTRCGYKPVTHIYKRNAQVIEKFGLIGTPNHPFITTKNNHDEIVTFQDLKLNDEVFAWNEKSLCIEIKTISDILNQKNHIDEIISTDTINGRVHQSHYIGKFMKIIMDQLKKEKRRERNEIVYNITVADCHEYFANNILVHNCMAYLHAIYVFYEGDNLQFFGIDNSIHPLSGPIEPDYEEHMESKSSGIVYHSTENITFEDIYINNRINMDQQWKSLVDKYPNRFVATPNMVQSKHDKDNTSIPAYIFHQINNF